MSKLNIDYSTVFSIAPLMTDNIITIIGICLLIGAMAKSSQIGQVKALVKLWYNSDFSWTSIYAGNVSNALKSVGPDFVSDPGKSLRQVTNQQGTNEKQFNKYFIEWFIGFSEGDGCFYITRGKSFFSIHLHIVDLPLLVEIKTQLNMGSISIGKKSALFTIKAYEEIKTLINLFNGKIYLCKRKKQFILWAKNFDNKYKMGFDAKDYTFVPCLQHNWLAGFIDAEGSFIVTVSKRKTREEMIIGQRIVLGQKDAEKEFTFLSNMLDGYTEKQKGDDRLVIHYSNSNKILHYLNHHPLYSVKAKSYSKWLEIHNIRKNNAKKFMDRDDFTSIKKKASLINILRKITKAEDNFSSK